MLSLNLLLFALSWTTHAHLFVGNPPPFLFHQSIDELIMPLNGDAAAGVGQQPFPCKGHHAGIDGSEGVPVATWQAGEEVTFQLFDRNNQTGAGMDQSVGAGHSGGSCQVSLSYDKGVTWVVIKNFEGNCPRVNPAGDVTDHYDLNQDYSFTVPDSFPTGNRVIFAWTWINASGNKEFYMSCSSVNIIGSGHPVTTTPKGDSLLVANLQFDTSLEPSEDKFWSSCHTEESSSITYPNSFSGINDVDRAAVALNLTPFQSDDPCLCESNNLDTAKKLGAINVGRQEDDSSLCQGAFRDDQSCPLDAPEVSIQTDVTLEGETEPLEVDVSIDMGQISGADQDSTTSSSTTSLSTTSPSTTSPSTTSPSTTSPSTTSPSTTSPSTTSPSTTSPSTTLIPTIIPTLPAIVAVGPTGKSAKGS